MRRVVSLWLPHWPVDRIRRRRAGIPVTALERLADGDAFGSLGVNRRDAFWTIKGLSDEVMPLFAAADERNRVIRSETQEPAAIRVATRDFR